MFFHIFHCLFMLNMLISYVSCQLCSQAHSRQHPTHQVIAPGGHHQPQSRPSRSAAHDLHRLRNGEAFAIAQVLGTFGTETIGGFVMFCQVWPRMIKSCESMCTFTHIFNLYRMYTVCMHMPHVLISGSVQAYLHHLWLWMRPKSSSKKEARTLHRESHVFLRSCN